VIAKALRSELADYLVMAAGWRLKSRLLLPPTPEEAPPENWRRIWPQPNVSKQCEAAARLMARSVEARLLCARLAKM
jgi:hypothetical protein